MGMYMNDDKALQMRHEKKRSVMSNQLCYKMDDGEAKMHSRGNWVKGYTTITEHVHVSTTLEYCLVNSSSLSYISVSSRDT